MTPVPTTNLQTRGMQGVARVLSFGEHASAGSGAQPEAAAHASPTPSQPLPVAAAPSSSTSGPAAAGGASAALPPAVQPSAQAAREFIRVGEQHRPAFLELAQDASKVSKRVLDLLVHAELTRPAVLEAERAEGRLGEGETLRPGWLGRAINRALLVCQLAAEKDATLVSGVTEFGRVSAADRSARGSGTRFSQLQRKRTQLELLAQLLDNAGRFFRRVGQGETE